MLSSLRITAEQEIHEESKKGTITAESAEQLLQLVAALRNFSEDSLYISIGTAFRYPSHPSIKNQQMPSFIEKISQSKSTRMFLIDPLFLHPASMHPINCIEVFAMAHEVSKMSEGTNQFQSTDPSKNLKINIFPCVLPYENFDAFYDLLKKTMIDVLNRGGQCFIANHTQSWSLDDIPRVAEVYNSVKSRHPQAKHLQLYTQAGNQPVTRYYSDQLYDGLSSEYAENRSYKPKDNEFKLCRDISLLESLDEFKPYLPALKKAKEEKPEGIFEAKGTPALFKRKAQIHDALLEKSVHKGILPARRRG